MLAVALGLGSSLCWGLADFFGGLQSRKRAMLAVLLVSQGAALVLLLPVAFALADEGPSASAVGWAALGGSAGVIALGVFYRSWRCSGRSTRRSPWCSRGSSSRSA